jgi:hypothetical protein
MKHNYHKAQLGKLSYFNSSNEADDELNNNKITNTFKCLSLRLCYALFSQTFSTLSKHTWIFLDGSVQLKAEL